jgi:hypothetical protein
MSNERKSDYFDEDLFDAWIDTFTVLDKSKEDKTPAQLREEFREKWGLVIAIPALHEGETPRDLLEKGGLYERPITEIYHVDADFPDVKVKKQEEREDSNDRIMAHVHFVEEAMLAGYHIEAVISRDTSSPLYRRLLRAEPRTTSYTFVLTAPPMQPPRK